MTRWNYDLKEHGIKLRELIARDDASKENCINIIEQVVVCCNWLQTHFIEEDKECYEFDIEDMILDCEDARYYIDEDDEDSNEENINDLLDQFYDLMDEMRVWITM